MSIKPCQDYCTEFQYKLNLGKYHFCAAIVHTNKIMRYRTVIFQEKLLSTFGVFGVGGWGWGLVGTYVVTVS